MIFTPLLAILICFAHFLADFVCQTNWMAQGKSKSNLPLFVHISVYSFVIYVVLFCSTLFLDHLENLFIFVLLNGICHFLIDFVTSRFASKAYAKGNMGSNSIPNLGFYSIIGFDQFLHMLVFFGTFPFVFGLEL